MHVTQVIIQYSSTVIGKIKEMPRSLFYDILCNVTTDYEKWYTSLPLIQVKKLVHLKFKIMSITCRFHVSDVDLVLACKKSHLGDAYFWFWIITNYMQWQTKARGEKHDSLDKNHVQPQTMGDSFYNMTFLELHVAVLRINWCYLRKYFPLHSTALARTCNSE